jgi:hypothetical protein
MIRAVDPPTEPYGYGSDVSCVTDIAPDIELVDPFTKRGLSESIIRQLTCPRGRIADLPDWGLDVRGMLSRGVTLDMLRTLAGQIRNELTKDDRVDDVGVDVETSSDYRALRIHLAVSAVDPGIGGFDLVFVVTPTTVESELQASAVAARAVLLTAASAPYPSPPTVPVTVPGDVLTDEDGEPFTGDDDADYLTDG